MKKNLFPTIVVSVLLALWGLVLFGYNYSQATIVSKTNISAPNLKNGLVFHHTFDGPYFSAVTSTDYVSSSNNGTIIGTVKKAVGTVGQGVRFLGTNNNYINIPTAYNSINLRTKTIAMWLKVDSTNVDGTQPILSNGTANYYVGLGAGRKLFLSLNMNTTTPGQVTFPSTGQYPIGKWFLSTVVINPVTDSTTTVTWYLNGIRDSVNTYIAGGLVTPTGADWIIGGFTPTSLLFNGWVDDLRVYNRALSSAEVMELYKISGGKISKTDATKPTLKTGLVGHWTFDGVDTTVVTTTDKSGNGNNGTRSATGTTAVIGKIGQAMKFSGDVGRDVVVTTSASLSPTSALSVAAWVKTTDTSGIIINKDDGGTNRQYSLLMNSGVAFYVFQAAATFSNTTAIGISDGKWHFIVGTLDINGDGKARMYIDGILRDTGSVAITSIATSTLAATIGDRPTNGFALQGTIDDARIYNRALSPAEITELYKMGGGKINKTDLTRAQLRSGLVGHWTFDGADVTAVTTTDKSGQGNDGTRTAVTPATGKIGQAMKFNGTTSRVSTTAILANSSSTMDHTYAAWVYMTKDSTGGLEWVINNGGVNDGTSLIIASGVIKFYYAGGNSVVQDSRTVKMSTWNHIATSYNALTNKVTFYLNGVASAQSIALGLWAASTEQVVLGRWGARDNWYFGGKIDDVRVYSRVLSPAEITELYRMGK